MFINLHTHDCKGSIRDAIAKPKDINKRVKDLGQLGYAITNHGSTSSLLTHYNLCCKNGLKFVFGLEAYITDNIYIKERGDYKHICLFAKNLTGYKNILKLATISYSEGFYYKPRIDWQTLIEHKDGLIIGSACMGGILGIEDADGQWDINAMSSTIEKYKKEFGDDFYIEIHTNQMPEQISMNKTLYNLCKLYKVQPLATCDSHYVYQDEAWIHKRWLGIDSENDENSYYTTDDFYIHSEEEVRKDLSYMDKDFVELSIQNTVKVFNDCNVEIDYNTNNFPVFKCDNQLEKVKEICRTGWRNKVMNKVPKEEQQKYLDQLLYEFEVLEKTKYLNLMLITWEFINWAKENGIRCGTGRGSSGSSLVSYLMGITEVDPIQHNLSFFRFCNPERVTSADIDTDVEQRNRPRIIEHLRDVYGYVYQVRTFSEMQPKAALQRACQCLNVSVKLQKELSKMVIDGETGADAYNNIPKDKTNKPIIELAIVFQGIVSNTGVHASAVMVFPKDPTEFCALEKQGDMLVCAYDYHELEQMGLAKVDVLGLKNLDIIQDTLDLIKETTGNNLDLLNIPLNDIKTYNLICACKTDGVFQIESNMMKSVTKELQPTKFEELYALVALVRPSVLQAGLHIEYIKEKRIAENE